MALTAMALSALGFLAAWRMDSVQGFHAVMNLLLMPMWLLSGALFPATGAAGWMRVVMDVNPLTFGLSVYDAAGALANVGTIGNATITRPDGTTTTATPTTSATPATRARSSRR